MKQVLAAIYTFIIAMIIGFGIAYAVRTPADQKLAQWNKITNFFLATYLSVKTYVTGLFAGSTPVSPYSPSGYEG